MHPAGRGLVETGDEAHSRVRQRHATPPERKADLSGMEVAGEAGAEIDEEDGGEEAAEPSAAAEGEFDAARYEAAMSGLPLASPPGGFPVEVQADIAGE